MEQHLCRLGQGLGDKQVLELAYKQVLELVYKLVLEREQECMLVLERELVCSHNWVLGLYQQRQQLRLQQGLRTLKV